MTKYYFANTFYTTLKYHLYIKKLLIRERGGNIITYIKILFIVHFCTFVYICIVYKFYLYITLHIFMPSVIIK